MKKKNETAEFTIKLPSGRYIDARKFGDTLIGAKAVRGWRIRNQDWNEDQETEFIECARFFQEKERAEREAGVAEFQEMARRFNRETKEMKMEQGRLIKKMEQRAEEIKAAEKKKIEEMERNAGIQYGEIMAFQAFNTVMHGKRSYDLTNAKIAREFIRLLCERGATSRARGIQKREIVKAMKQRTGSVANDWRPAHAFRKNLAPLYEAIGRNETAGTYWIK